MNDTFRGDTAALIASIEALLSLDAAGALVPHGVGGHARTLLESAAARLTTPPQAVPLGGGEVNPEELASQNIEAACRLAHPGWDNPSHYGEIAKSLRRAEMAAKIATKPPTPQDAAPAVAGEAGNFVIPRRLAYKTWAFLAQDCSPCAMPDCQIDGKNTGVDSLVAEWYEVTAATLAVVQPTLVKVDEDGRRYRFLRDGEFILNGSPFIAISTMGGISQWTGASADEKVDAAIRAKGQA